MNIIRGSSIKPLVQQAEEAVTYAQGVRRYHRRNTEKGDPSREVDIKRAWDVLYAAAKPIKSSLMSLSHMAQTDERMRWCSDLEEASAALQSEYRKLWKMSAYKKNGEPKAKKEAVAA